MVELGKHSRNGEPTKVGARRLVDGAVTAWRFVYGFFSNGTPYDAPNRSETCPS